MPTFEDNNANITGVYTSSVATGDYDGDGDLDLLIAGSTNSNGVAKIYDNDGTGGFTEDTSANLTGVFFSSVATGDYDGDGDLDLLITGYNNNSFISKIYDNDGSGGFTEDTSANLTGVDSGSVATGDYDGDGDLDLLITGLTPSSNINSGPTAKIYDNDGIGGFTEDTSVNLTGVYSSSVATGDYDRDGDLDLLITGYNNNGRIAKIYDNDGSGGFTEDTSANLTGVSSSSVATGDYDGDGDLDLLITGEDDNGQGIAKIYDNDGSGGFTEDTSVSLTGVSYSSVATGDYDGDGDLDLLITGQDNSDRRIAKIYDNDGSGGFTEDTSVSLTGVARGSVAIGDYDGDGDGDLLITGLDRNNNPIAKVYSSVEITITSSDRVNLDENIVKAATVTAEDSRENPVYSISGGIDRNLFEIDSNSGVLVFKNAPDYENPVDNNRDNIYEVEVSVSDGDITKTQNLTVAVNDVNEFSIASSNTANVNENTSIVIDVVAEDPEGDPISYSINKDVKDNSFFSIDNTGILAFKNAPNYENPVDRDRDNVYEVEVSASDGNRTKTQILTVTVNDINELSIASSNTVNIDENTSEVTTVTANEPDAGDTVSYSLTGGSDANLFNINPNNGVLTFKDAPDYENPVDRDRDNVYEVEVSVTDSKLTKTQNLSVTVNDVNELSIASSNTANVDENTSEVTTITANEPDAGDTVSYSLTGGSDANLFNINPKTGVLAFKNAPDYENPGNGNLDNTYEVEVNVTDGELTKTQNLSVAVNDVNELSVNSNYIAYFNGGENEKIQVKADEPDAGDVLTYSLTGGSDRNLFSIDETTGELAFNNPPDYNNPGDSNSDNSYEVEVTISDGEITKAQNISIEISADNLLLAPVTDTDPSENIITGNPLENPSAGITASSSNANNDTITYSLSDDFDGAFAIDSDTGVVTVADSSKLNYRVGQEYNITVEASNGFQTVSKDFVIAADTTSVLNSLIERDSLIQLTNQFLSLIPGFTLSYSEDPEKLQKKLQIDIDNFIGDRSELDLAKALGITNPQNIDYKIISAIVDTVDGTEADTTNTSNTSLDIDGLTYSSEIIEDNPDTPDINEAASSLGLSLNIGRDGKNKFSWKKLANGYEIGYDGTIDIVAIIKLFTDRSDNINLPDDFALNVDGFNVKYLESNDSNQAEFRINVGAVSNTQEGLDIATLLNITDTNSLGYKFIGGVVDTFDGSEAGVVDTVLGFDGLNLRVNDSSVNLSLTINENEFGYLQKDDGFSLNYGGTVDILAMLKVLGNETGLVTLPNEFTLDVEGFNIDYTKSVTQEKIDIKIGKVSNTEEGLDLASMFGISDPNSLDYRLVSAIVDTIDGSEVGVVDTTLNIDGLSYSSEATKDDPDTLDIDETSAGLELNLDIGEDLFTYRANDNGYKLAYEGSVDVLAILRVLIDETGLITLPNEFALNVNGFEFDLTKDEETNTETLNLTIGSLTNTEEGLDLASMFGISDTTSIDYKLVSAIVDTIDGSEAGVVDTTLNIDKLAYSSETTKDDPNTIEDEAAKSVGFNLGIDNRQLTYSTDESGYQLSYNGSIDVLAILRVLTNETGLITLPDEFALNVNGFAIDYTESPTQENIGIDIGGVSNTDDGLDLAAMFGITDTNSFGYKLAGGIVDTIDGSEAGVVDTVLGFNGLDLNVNKDLETNKTNLDLEFAIDESILTYSQASKNKYELSYDGTLDILALAKVLVNETGIINLPNNFAFNIDGFDVSLETDEQNKVVDYELDINKVSKETIVNLFSSLSLPEFINSFINAIAGDLQLIVNDNSFSLNYRDKLRIDAVLESIASALGFNVDLPSLSVNDPSFSIGKENGETTYELSIPQIDSATFLTSFIDSIGIDIPDVIKKELAQIGNVSLNFSNDGMLLAYQDELEIDFGSIFSFGGSIQAVEDIIDSLTSVIFGSDKFVVNSTQKFGILTENGAPEIYLSSAFNGDELSFRFSKEKVNFGYELGELDFDFLGKDLQNIFSGIKLNQSQLFTTNKTEVVNLETIGEILMVNGVNLVGQIDFTKAKEEDIIGRFINKHLRINALAAHVGIAPESGLSLSGKAILDIPLLSGSALPSSSPISDFNLTLKELNLGVDADFTSQEYSLTLGGGIILEGYDPFQTNEPLLRMDGGLTLGYNAISQAPTFTGFYSLKTGETWSNVFGIPDTEVRTLAMQVGGAIQVVPTPAPIPVPRPDNIGWITNFRWGTIDVDLAMKIDIDNPTDIAGTFTLNRAVGLAQLFAGPISPFIATIDSTLLDDAIAFIDSTFNAKIVSADSDGDGKLDPLVQFVPLETEIAGIPLQKGIGINGEFSGYGASATLSLQSNETYTSFAGSVKIPEIIIKSEGDISLITLSGSSDDTLNLDFTADFTAGLSEISLKGDGRLDMFGQEIARADFSITPTRIDVRELDLDLGELITLDIDDFFLDTETLSGGGAVELDILGQKVQKSNFSIEKGTKYSLDIEQLGFGNLLALQDVDLDLDFTNASASGASTLVLLGQPIQRSNFGIDTNGINLNSSLNINSSLGSINSNFGLDISKNGFSVKGDSNISLAGIEVDLGFTKIPVGGLDFNAELNLEADSNGLRGSIEDLTFNIFDRQIGSYDLTFDTGSSVDSWDDVLKAVYDSAKDKVFSLAKQIFLPPVPIVENVINIFRGWWNGYTEGAQVWLDTDKNGLLDSGEPSGITKVDGSFVLQVPEDFDLANGVIRSIGGIDTATGLPVLGVTSAPANANLTPLTSLVQGLIDNGATLDEATVSIRNALNISSDVNLLDFNHVEEAIDGNPDARNVLLGVNTVKGIISGVLNLLAGASDNTIDDRDPVISLVVTNAAYSSLAEFIDRDTFDLEDFEDSTKLEEVIRNAATDARVRAEQQGITLKINDTSIDNTANGAARVLAAGATKKRLLGEESTDGIDLFTKITQAKLVSDGEEANALNEFARGNVSAAEISDLADTSEVALQEISDVDLNPQLAGIPDLYLVDDQKILDLPITLFDFETPYEELKITISSDNQTLLPDENISIAAGNSPQEALFSVSPIDGESGEATVTITVEDSAGNVLDEDISVNVETNGVVNLDSFTFSKRSDVVEENNVILIPGGSSVFTLAGDDTISSVYTTDTPTISLPTSEGSSEAVFGIDNQGSLDTSSGRDTIIGDVEYTGESLVPAVHGITQAFDGKNNGFTSATILTGSGNDKVSGLATSSNSTDIVGISNTSSSETNTGAGRDEVRGEADGNASVSLLGIAQSRGDNQIITDDGADKVIGKASGNLEVISEELGGIAPGIVGISQQEKQKISTGNGADEVIGEASGTATADNPRISVPIMGIAKSNSTIETGNSADRVIGKASGTAGQMAGISQQGSEDLIITENGNDEVIGTASGTAVFMAGITQQPGTAGSQIITGKGNDKVIGTASNNSQGLITAGILGDLDILTGLGNDEVIASAEQLGTRVDGFAADRDLHKGGSVTVDTGSGNDLVKGFGQGHFDGGRGNRDIYDLSEYRKSEFTIEIGAGGNNEVNFTHTDTFGESTALTQGFEVFRFADGEFSFSDLA